VTEVRFSTTWSSRSFSMTISVSTRSRRFSTPWFACCVRLPPSKTNGFVTTPTVSAWSSRASSATLVAALLRGGLADRRVGAGAEAARRLRADVDLHVGVAHHQRLRVGVDRDELDPAEARIDHAVDRVRSAAADADDLDHREIVTRLVAHAHADT
jgi:hypothetical protein